LLKLLKENNKKIMELRFAGAGSQVRNTKEKSNLRKEVARILTELKSRVKSNN